MYNNSKGNYEYRGSQFSFDGKWDFCSTAASASMSSCALKKRGMNQVYKGSQLKSLKAFYEPARLSEFKQGQMNLALLCAMIAGGVSFNFVET